MQHIEQIGPYWITGTCSDDAGNTSKGRRLLCTKFWHIFNMADACHGISNCIKDICALQVFKPVRRDYSTWNLIQIFRQAIKDLRSVMTFMSQSTYTLDHFDDVRLTLGITRGLEAIGETRFSTIYWSSLSMLRGFPAMIKVVQNKDLRIENEVCEEIILTSLLR